MDGEGGGFDPCECVFSHEAAMSRLLSLLRNTQTDCTENECFRGNDGTPSSLFGDGSTVGMMLLWFALAVVLFLSRPASLRHSGDGKPSRTSEGPSGPPPAPLL
ncbi:hypothetical protein M514_07849 [Trichuris suis]|uniref:Small integral membrane protein 14 n=1 Tax=Trichuris suis TaxID=68888 RepID=A0A085M203_9BILA|nr:hypothetical protein M513_07849 [Trichuris suis]KFD64652.1 hypothetical protein M514_07849 [Trichuris suis]KHJ42529.1 hypothetical protein D918_07451 [Trichuris suis]